MDIVSLENKHKVPHPYSRAEDIARSLTGFGMTNLREDYSDIETGLEPRIFYHLNRS
jgi:hypothetical protein